MIKNYDEFLKRGQDLGFMAFSKGFLDNFTSLENETLEEHWHTGDKETDPWQWRVRCVKDHRFAFGCILGGDKGFISKEMYPYFYAAYRPTAFPRELYQQGILSQTAYELYQLFEEHEYLSTPLIRTLMNQHKKISTSRLDTATKELQKLFYITVNGTVFKQNAKGEEYGWPSNQYTFIENWVPTGWIPKEHNISKTNAIEFILNHAKSHNPDVDYQKLSKKLFGKQP